MELSEAKDLYEAIDASDGDRKRISDWQISTLSSKLNPQAVKKNPRGFDYLEGWYVIDILNRTFGFDGWSGKIIELSVGAPAQAKIGKDDKDGWKQGAYCVYELEVHFYDGHNVSKPGVGYGSSSMQDKVLVEESAVKEAETDAMKRAARYLGNKFGNALYDKQKRGVG